MAVFVYIACSLDGFIAKPDGDLRWLTELPDEGRGDFGFAAFLSGIDGIVMGRKTYETVLGFPEWPYRLPVFVLSEGLAEVTGIAKGRAEILRGRPDEIVDTLAKRGIVNIYVDGGMTIRSFLEADLVDEMIVTTVSKIIGGGISLFGGLGREREFKVVETGILTGSLVRSRYLRVRERERGNL